MARYACLELSEAEKQELLAYDKAIEAGEKTLYDLSPEQNKVAQEFARTGTKKPTAYKFSPRQRKPNATKGGLIEELSGLLENSQFAIENIVIINKERQIAFSIGGDNFELTLVQKRKKK